MAVDANAISLSEYGMMSNDPMVRRIVFTLLTFGSVLQDIPLTTRQTLVANGARWQDNLPSGTWRKLNEEGVATKGKPTPIQEQVYILNGMVDVDDKILRDENQIGNPQALQMNAFLEWAAYEMNDKFINNNHSTGDADAPVGLRQRLDDTTSWKIPTEMKLDAGGVDLSQAGMTAATANNFLELVDQLLFRMGAPNGDGVVLYLNDTLHRRFARAIRLLGAGAGFSTDQDAFARRIDMYRNARVRVIGRKSDQATDIITNTETNTGADGASTFSSIYGVRYGEESFFGWQFDSLEGSVRNLGLLDNGTIHRIVLDWAVGLFQQHQRAVSRLYDIKMS